MDPLAQSESEDSDELPPDPIGYDADSDWDWESLAVNPHILLLTFSKHPAQTTYNNYS